MRRALVVGWHRASCICWQRLQDGCPGLKKTLSCVPSGAGQMPVAGTGVVPVRGEKSGAVWAALNHCFLMVSVEPMDALMMAVRAVHWARLSCSPRKRKPERAASAGSRLMRMLNVREGRFFSAMISTP